MSEESKAPSAVAPPPSAAASLDPETKARYQAIAAKIWAREGENQELVLRAKAAPNQAKRDYWMRKARGLNTKSGERRLFRGASPRHIEAAITRAIAGKRTEPDWQARPARMTEPEST